MVCLWHNIQIGTIALDETGSLKKKKKAMHLCVWARSEWGKRTN